MTCDDDGRDKLERRDEVRLDRQRALGRGKRTGRVVRRLEPLRFLEQVLGARRVVSRQWIASTMRTASSSVNTRNELVRTLPWLLTASETRVIVSSSGASAITT